MTTPDRQRIFDAVHRAVETHAPKLAVDIRIAIATDTALHILGVTHDKADADGAAAQRYDRRIKR